MDNKIIVMYRAKKYLKILSIALLFLLIGLVIYEYIKITPKDVNFTNITSSSVTVSWTTKSVLPGVVFVQEKNSLLPLNIFGIGKEKFFDTRDVRKAEIDAVASTQEKSSENGTEDLSISDFETELIVKEKSDYFTHHVIVKGLDPEKEYYFMIGDALLFTSAKDIKNISKVKTLPTPEGIVTPQPAYGTITDAQNSDDMPLNLQTPVSDAVVYLNFLDNETGKRSNVFSSSVNSSGNWYMDVSSAVDEMGNPFLETYNTVKENVFAEILIDAGPLGKWSKIENSNWISPVSWSVLNMPNAIEQKGMVGALTRIDEEKEVKGALLSTVNAGLIECDATCGTWNLSTNKCVCPSGMKVNSSGGCVCVSGTFNPSNCSCTTYTPPPGETTPPPAPSPVCGGKAIYWGVNATSDQWKNASYCAVGDPNNEPSLPAAGTSVSWKCENGDASKTCTATREGAPTPPTCGSKAGNYSYLSADAKASWDAGAYCGVGEPTSTPGLPDQGASVSWVCKKDDLTVSCKASRQGLVSPSKENCTHLLTWCGDCYYKDQNEQYVKCDQSLCTKPIECSSTPPQNQEQYSCSPSGKLYESCTNVNELCYRCEWAQIGTSYGAKWVGTGGESCIGISNQQISNCSASAAQTKCVNSGGEWANDSCACSPTKYLKLEDGACVCSVQNMVRDGDSCKVATVPSVSCLTAKEGTPCDEKDENKVCTNGVCVVKTPISAGCQSKGESCSNTDYLSGGPFSGICNEKFQCVKVGSICSIDNPGPLVEGFVYKYNSSGNCVISNECKTGYEKDNNNNCIQLPNSTPSPSTDKYCWETGWLTFLYRVSDENKAQYCFKGEWEDITPLQDDKCLTFANEKTGECGYFNPVYCYIQEKDELYQCKENEWSRVDRIADGSKEVVATSIDIVQAEEECNKIQGCFCVSTQQRINDGEICPVTKVKLVQASKQYTIVNQVLGQSTSSSTGYIMDPQTGMFSDIKAGSYIFEYNNDSYSFLVSEADLVQGNGSVLIYIDINENGVYDEGTDTKVSDLASTVNIVALEQKFDYQLEEGFNFISIPFLISNEESRTAAGLLKKLNDVYGENLFSISKYDGTWRVVGQNSQVYDNDDFQLIPGQGYIVKAKKDMNISIVGKPVQFESENDSAQISLYKGWNLIGLYGNGIKSYTAKSLIQDINAYETPDFTANNVTRWESDAQKYDGYQLENENGVDMEYGFDFPINLLQGYFVRVQDGSGNWQPELR